MIIDAHTHLNTNQLFGDYKKYLENFERIWWKILVNAWANNEYNQKWIQMAKESNDFSNLTVKTAIWRHPCDIPQNESDFLSHLDGLEKIYQENRDYIVAIGECGIDLHFSENPTVEVQQNALKLQAQLARKLDLPLMIHSRDGFRETMEVLKEFSGLKVFRFKNLFSCSGILKTWTGRMWKYFSKFANRLYKCNWISKCRKNSWSNL